MPEIDRHRICPECLRLREVSADFGMSASTDQSTIHDPQTGDITGYRRIARMS